MSPRKNQVDLATAIGNELRADEKTGGEATGGRTDDATPEASAPSAEDVVAPRRRQVRRRALNVDVPDDLQLHRRGHLYRIEEGIDMRDQVALAYDAWLRERGY